MKRIHQILSTGFLALVLFLNIGLTLNLGNGLHAHFLGNNQILIHFHHSQGGEHSHSSSDCGSSTNYVFSTTLTYLNNFEGITLKSLCRIIDRKTSVLSKGSYQAKFYNHSPWRGPPMA
ncbi:MULTISPECIES: hypothetical protein [unclassified Saccharicrinis]|uniref:hypothetical protein n=1 Tax=unclassified Saccharicrinis TaxID=2646859 RepID=UPI003D3520D9